MPNKQTQNKNSLWRIIYFMVVILMVTTFAIAQEEDSESKHGPEVEPKIKTISIKNLPKDKTKPMIKSVQVKALKESPAIKKSSKKITPTAGVLEKSIQVDSKEIKSVSTAAIDLKKDDEPPRVSPKILKIKKQPSKLYELKNERKQN